MLTPELTKIELELRAYILATILLQGTGPGLEAMMAAIKDPSQARVRAGLRSLERKKWIVRQPNSKEILAAYPLSIKPTEHAVTLSAGYHVFAVCAIDALGVPLTFSQDAQIHSLCKSCHSDIAIEISEGEIKRRQPEGLRVLYTPLKTSTCPVSYHCPTISFFCSSAHINEGFLNTPAQPVNVFLTLAQAFQLARHIFGAQPVEAMGDQPFDGRTAQLLLGLAFPPGNKRER
ncbi:MAG: hypothetical protein HYR55_13165 [Acidobacteria bacterium]|nr:hypothetical protein [Acidobacteriota bacterium]